MPRDKNIVVFGTHIKAFSGNIRSLFIMPAHPYRKIFISHSADLTVTLQAQGYEAYDHLSIKGIYYALRAGTHIYSAFPSDTHFWLSNGAKYINVWHGTPIKKIERDVTTGKYSLKNRYPFLFTLLKPYLKTRPHLLLSASDYESNCFQSAFGITEEALFKTFPPRLVPLLEPKAHNSSLTHILYVPTWRDDHSFNFFQTIDATFDHFLQRHQFIFHIKLHPSDKSVTKEHTFSHIKIIDQHEDVYEYLHQADIVVSDYSSMIFEALYLSKPVLLFCPDIQTYTQHSREFYIDPCTQLPVLVSFTQNELETKLLTLKAQEKQRYQLASPFKPYQIEDKIVEKLVRRAHRA